MEKRKGGFSKIFSESSQTLKENEKSMYVYSRENCRRVSEYGSRYFAFWSRLIRACQSIHDVQIQDFLCNGFDFITEAKRAFISVTFTNKM